MGPRAGRVQAQEHDMMAQQRSSPKVLEPLRMPGGFSGAKLRMSVERDPRQASKEKAMMKGGVLPGSAPPGGGKRYPIQRVFTPNMDPVGLSVSAMSGKNRGSRRTTAVPRVSSILLELEDEEEPDLEPGAAQDKEYSDMRSLSELHHEELSVMKKEILGLRAELESEFMQRRDQRRDQPRARRPIPEEAGVGE